MDDAARVEVLEREHDLGGVEARVLLEEQALLPQVEEELSAGQILRDEGESARISVRYRARVPRRLSAAARRAGAAQRGAPA